MRLTHEPWMPTLPAVEEPHTLAPMARGRPRSAEPHIHGHWTKITAAQEAAWQEVLVKLGGGGVFLPQDSRAVRYAMGALAKSLGVAWPDPEEQGRSVQELHIEVREPADSEEPTAPRPTAAAARRRAR